VIDLLAEHGVAPNASTARPASMSATLAKIAALGLRIRNGCCYHGRVSLNVDMDLSPFAAINPCGYAGMAVTRPAISALR
jgi:lipoyl(octanoyl) transferase